VGLYRADRASKCRKAPDGTNAAYRILLGIAPGKEPFANPHEADDDAYTRIWNSAIHRVPEGKSSNRTASDLVLSLVSRSD
jgi:hypothetical protein